MISVKHSNRFQRYIRDVSGYEREEAHIEGGRGRGFKLTIDRLLAIQAAHRK